jgi:hypothetical protein
MPIEPSTVDNILRKYCYGAPEENREACAKELKEEFEAYRASTSQHISLLENQLSDLQCSLEEERDAKEEAGKELAELELSREWEDAVKQFWQLCERAKG